MLENLGLTDEASAVYLAMLTESTWTLPDIVAKTKVPERAVRKALDQLADLKLLELSTTGDECRIPGKGDPSVSSGHRGIDGHEGARMRDKPNAEECLILFSQGR